MINMVANIDVVVAAAAVCTSGGIISVIPAHYQPSQSITFIFINITHTRAIFLMLYIIKLKPL